MQGEERLRREEHEITSWDAECDVLVLGMGCAGACAAIEAAHSGADTLVLERAGGGGGTSANSGGFLYLGGGTAIQQACGFEDSPEEMFKYMMAACGPSPDAELISPYCEHSVEHFDWIVAQGVPFNPKFFADDHEPFHSDEGLVYTGSEKWHPFNEIARPAPRGHAPRQIESKGSLLMKHLLEGARRAGVRVQSQQRCEALVIAGDGRVIGAVSRSPDGVHHIRARGGVVIATGGFIYNDDMLAAYAPWLLRCSYKVGTENDDGSGIRLGLAAGGEAIRMHAGDVSLTIFPPNQLKKGLFINRYGQRYLNEDVYFGRAGEYALYHQEGEIYLVVDDEIFARPDLYPVEIAAVGETIAELEEGLGLPGGSLQHTVELYNHHAERLEDPVFHKSAEYLKPLDRPPFGALDLRADNSVYAGFTLGGLHIDATGAVLRPSGEPVPGLFAAGRATSGVAKHGYSSGMSLGDGSFFGRRAGRSAAGASTG
ncbi:MAG: FAD-dependent oxidoreductase [Deltaproteobacteria bacterium]|jgi:3-oxo-5alpha-steroid 4-dehydrogenase|nr:FAD-dependent oxidoreductase [Deltaproteobacteria bacterium]